MPIATTLYSRNPDLDWRSRTKRGIFPIGRGDNEVGRPARRRQLEDPAHRRQRAIRRCARIIATGHNLVAYRERRHAGGTRVGNVKKAAVRRQPKSGRRKLDRNCKNGSQRTGACIDRETADRAVKLVGDVQKLSVGGHGDRGRSGTAGSGWHSHAKWRSRDFREVAVLNRKHRYGSGSRIALQSLVRDK